MIKPPAWCPHAVPGPNGWTDPKSGDTLVSTRFTQQEIDEFYGAAPVVEQVQVQQPQMLNEAPANNKSLEDMTEVEIDAVAEQSGVAVKKAAPKKKAGSNTFGNRIKKGVTKAKNAVTKG